MGSTEDYLDNLLANAVSQGKSSQKTKASSISADSGASSNSSAVFNQSLETEEGRMIGLDDMLPEDYMPEPEPYIDEKNQELGDKLVLDSRIPADMLPDENEASKLSINDINADGFEEFNPSSKFESFLSEFGEEDIEKRLADAADVSDVKEGHFNNNDEVVGIIEAISESGDDSMNDIADLLKASDNNKIVDKSLLDKLEKAESMGDQDHSDSDAEEIGEEEKGKKNGKKLRNKGTGLFGKLFGKKNKKADNDESLATDGSSDDGEISYDDINDANANARPDNDFDKLLAETASDAGHPVIYDEEDTNQSEEKNVPESHDFFDGKDSDGLDSNDEGDSAGAEDEEENGEDAKPKKKGLLARLLDIFTEEEPEVTLSGEEGNLVSDENKAILDEVDAEEEDKKKGKKKGKKEKKEKEPKEKKEKKPKKPKKEKVVEPIDPKKIVPKKMKMTIFALAFSILVVLLLLMKFIPTMMNMSDARKSYYAKDYKDTFISMYGKELSDSDRILYEKAKILVLIERKYESYENYMTMDMPLQALDALLQGLDKYEVVKDRAEEYEVLEELNAIRDKLLAALALQFGVSEEEAMEILTYAPVDYTLKLQSIIDGTEFIKVQDMINSGIGFDNDVVIDETDEPDIYTEQLPDMLPEEENIPSLEIEQDAPGQTGGDVEIIIESEQF